ncbi:DUF494 domain-containing protein [Photobacterium carnosum]|uniref:DUF494 family protein n=1 Tax=Photobacterium carnosum TaxID=2023717 RepID=UPI001E4E68C3|nr:DUF494 family protein [Photobacterium carnosum]MCD9557906.1 DUF494 domain-containing protein [Photobacterium carnosum]
MMDILMYLFETYIQSEAELLVDQEELSEELLRVGFHQDDIYKSLEWLEKLAALQETENTPYVNHSAITSMRIYTADEMLRMDTACRGFLLYLEQIDVLNTDTREMVIDRVMELDTQEFVLDDLKWIILMVLFNAPGNEAAYDKVEELLYGAEDGGLH